MPHLVKGHMRYTDEDYAYTEYQEKIETMHKNHCFFELLDMLEQERLLLLAMKDNELLAKFKPTARLVGGAPT